MTKTLLEKMFLKSEYAAAVLNLPKELDTEFYSERKIYTILEGKYNFILAFYSKKQELQKDALKLKKALLPNALLWVAYPKNKALETDLNRDILHELLKEYGLDSVSLVSLNATWSAMRFKVL